MTAQATPAMAEEEPLVESARRRWRRARPQVLIGLLVVAAAVVLAVIAARPQAGTLDPDAATPGGGRALAELLRDQGVTITSVETFADATAQLDGGPATLFVTVPDRLPDGRLTDLARRAAVVVLVAPTTASIETLLPDLLDVGAARVEARAPGCDLPAAVAAGSAHAGGITYELLDESSVVGRCYPVGGRPTLIQVETAGSRITVVGSGVPFTNDRLDEHGNAALAMRLLGEHARLVWYQPAVTDAEAGDESLLDLLPDGWRWAAVQLLIAAGLLALWRARRLGPVVVEPLPVVVRAAEAVEGRGRLYRSVQARDRAADALREASRARLREPLGLGRDVTPQVIVAAIADRTPRNVAEVTALLYGAPPQDDRALVQLAAQLDALESEVRRS